MRPSPITPGGEILKGDQRPVRRGHKRRSDDSLAVRHLVICLQKVRELRLWDRLVVQVRDMQLCQDLFGGDLLLPDLVQEIAVFGPHPALRTHSVREQFGTGCVQSAACSFPDIRKTAGQGNSGDRLIDRVIKQADLVPADLFLIGESQPVGVDQRETMKAITDRCRTVLRKPECSADGLRMDAVHGKHSIALPHGHQLRGVFVDLRCPDGEGEPLVVENLSLPGVICPVQYGGIHQHQIHRLVFPFVFSFSLSRNGISSAL